jgi:hypothetical protein
VDQHPVGRARFQRLETIAHGGLPRRPAVDCGKKPVAIEPRHRCGVRIRIARGDYDLDEIDAGVLQERAERASQHRPAADTRVLLGQRRGCPRAAATGNDQCGGLQSPSPSHRLYLSWLIAAGGGQQSPALTCFALAKSIAAG